MEMGIKKFLLRVLIFTIVSFPILSFKSFYAYYTRSYEMVVNGSEVYLSVRKSKSKKKAKIFIIGDSVGKQLYDNEVYNDEIYSTACNQAISMAGYYILLQNFFERNKGNLPERVLLIITPETLKNNLDQVYTFHYFLKPFYKTEYKKYLNQVCEMQIKKVPLYFLSQSPFILNSNWSPSYKSSDQVLSYQVVSPVSNDYLAKIKELCVKNHCLFEIHSPPAKEKNREEIQRKAGSISEFKKCGLESELNTYFREIKFMADTLFQDHVHLKKQYIPIDYLHLVGKPSDR